MAGSDGDRCRGPLLRGAYAADLTALRFIPQRFFGVFMSVNPVLAALAGMLLLGQDLAVHEWLGIAIVVTANIFATLRQQQAR